MFDANPLVQVATQVDVEFRPNKEGLDGHVATQLPVDESANRPPEQVVAHFHARLSRKVPVGQAAKQMWLVSSPNVLLGQLFMQTRVVFRPYVGAGQADAHRKVALLPYVGAGQVVTQRLVASEPYSPPTQLGTHDQVEF